MVLDILHPRVIKMVCLLFFFHLPDITLEFSSIINNNWSRQKCFFLMFGSWNEYKFMRQLHGLWFYQWMPFEALKVPFYISIPNYVCLKNTKLVMFSASTLSVPEIFNNYICKCNAFSFNYIFQAKVKRIDNSR